MGVFAPGSLGCLGVMGSGSLGVGVVLGSGCLVFGLIGVLCPDGMKHASVWFSFNRENV